MATENRWFPHDFIRVFILSCIHSQNRVPMVIIIQQLKNDFVNELERRIRHLSGLKWSSHAIQPYNESAVLGKAAIMQVSSASHVLYHVTYSTPRIVMFPLLQMHDLHL